MRPVNGTPLFRLYAERRRHHLEQLDPAAAQAQELRQLVAQARQTRFGRDHHFEKINNVIDYQRHVPLRRYEDFLAEYWRPFFPVLTDVTWPGRIPFFALSSGTSSGASKAIPVSHAMVRANRRAALDVLVWHLASRPRGQPLAGKTLILGGSTALTRLTTGVYSGDLSGIAAKTIPFWAKPYTLPGSKLALLADWDEKLERIAGAAIHEPIRVLSGTPSWLILLFERILALRGGKGPALPELELLIHGGVAFAPYADRFADYLRATGAATREVYAASEGFIAVADRGPGEGLRLLPDNGIFFEFVPVEELSAPRPTRHWLGNLETGIPYAVVLSSNAGLWSDVIGDTVRFVDRQPPRLLVTGRLSYMMSAFGEHLTGEEIEQAVLEAARRMDMQITDFSMGAEFPSGPDTRGRHTYIIECGRPLPPAAARPALAGRFAAHIDATLMERNADYREHRRNDVQLDAPRVILVDPGTFAHWLRARGRLGGQNKVPRVINDQALFADLKDHVAAVQGDRF
ncbi:MAG: GH3 family domain-containing protein [Acidithiobacillus sp.]|uniref:GH3 family domain-containing protein n=1 Tax=Acidithiobacillus sp. TaxID=1872118 RepID=UPI003CFCEB76